MKNTENNILSDALDISGFELSKFKKIAEKIDNATKIETIEPDCLTVLHCYNQKKEGDVIVSRCHVLYDDCIQSDDEGKVEVETQVLRSVPSSIIHDLDDDCLLNFDMDYVDMSKSYFLSRFAVKTLANKLAVKMGYIAKKGYTRSLLLANLIPQLPLGVSVVSRTSEDDKYHKIFAFIGGRFKRTNLMDLAGYVEVLEEKKCKLLNWRVRNDVVRIDLKYNANFVISLQVSDSGEISDGIRLYYMKNDFMFEVANYDLSNLDSINIEGFMKQLSAFTKSYEANALSIKPEAFQKILSDAIGNKAAALVTRGGDIKEDIFNVHKLLDLTEYQEKMYSKIFLNVV